MLVPEEVGGEMYQGACIILTMLKKSSSTNPWLVEILASFDESFCLTNADLLIRGGSETVGWDFSQKMRALLKENCKPLDECLNALAVQWGVGFKVGAILQLELIRRKEEDLEPWNGSVQ